MSLSTPSFEDMASFYDDLFEDLDNLVRLEGQGLARILRSLGAQQVLDCACGTGIQTLGLLQQGFGVSASDLSPAMVRATIERASTGGWMLEGRTADFQNLAAWGDQSFDAVLCVGNSLTLLPDLSSVDRALDAMLRHTRPGGAIVIGIRRYGVSRQSTPGIVLRNARPGVIILDRRTYCEDSTEVEYIALRQTPNGGWGVKSSVKRYLELEPRLIAARVTAAGGENHEFWSLAGDRAEPSSEWFVLTAERPRSA